MFSVAQRWPAAIALAIVVCSAGTATGQFEPASSALRGTSEGVSSGCGHTAACSYGPCVCSRRQTLMQWSYGTSFSGGPDRNAPLVTDRPDFTEASSTVGVGTVQLEMGYTYSIDNDGVEQVRGHSAPEMLARIGMLAEWFELRVAYNYLDERSSLSGTMSGSDDLYLGIKIALTPQECLLPEMAIMPQMFVPTGSAGFNAGEVLPALGWLYTWEINDWLSTAGNTQWFKTLDETTNEPYSLFTQSWTIGVSFTDALAGYTEWYALMTSGADTDLTQHYFNGGLTYLVSNDLQLDIRAGTGLSNNADDFFIGGGLSVRF